MGQRYKFFPKKSVVTKIIRKFAAIEAVFGQQANLFRHTADMATEWFH